MTAVLRIAWREVRERRFLLTAAVSLSLLALAVQVVPVPALGPREALAVLLFFQFPTVVALAVGSSLIGRDLAEGRLSFYFSRPLSAGALWAGKFLGGTALVVVALVSCIIPLSLALGKGGDPWVAGVHLLVLLNLMAFAHTTATMFRSGSRLLALDLGLGAVFCTLWGVEIRDLAIAGAGRVVVGAIPVALAASAVAMLAAAAAQLAYGRADTHRGHKALSFTLWPLAAAGLAAFALWGGWLLRVTPAEAGDVGSLLLAAPRGSAFFCRGFSGHGRAGFKPAFLMDGETSLHIPVAPERFSAPAFAADGTVAVWVAPAVPWWWYVAPYEATSFRESSLPWGRRGLWDFAGDEYLVVARLDHAHPAIQERPLNRSESWSEVLALDHDGRRALVPGRSSVALLDVASGEVIKRVALVGVMAAEFRPDGIVRFYQSERDVRGPGTFVVLDWNPTDGSRVERVRLAGSPRGSPGFIMFLLARRGDLAVVSTGVRTKTMVDAATGAVRVFSSSTVDAPGSALLLSTGQVALTLGDEVRIVTRDGTTVASVPLEPKTHVSALREPAPGELAVGLWSLSLGSRLTLFVDAATGAVRHQEKDLLPAGPTLGLPAPEPGSLASRLFTDLEGALIALEPGGRRRTIVAGRE